MCSNAFPEMHSEWIRSSVYVDRLHCSFIVSEECLITTDPSKYHYVAQGMLTIDNVDDAEEMRITDDAFDVLGFTKVSIESIQWSYMIDGHAGRHI
jgi:hypothetical protein